MTDIGTSNRSALGILGWRIVRYFLPAFILGTLAGGVGGYTFAVSTGGPKVTLPGFVLGCFFAMGLAFVFAIGCAVAATRPVPLALAQLIGGTAGLFLSLLIDRNSFFVLGLAGQFFGGVVGLIVVPRDSPRPPNPGVCEKCGYNLTGLTEPRCPECGTPFAPEHLVLLQK